MLPRSWTRFSGLMVILLNKRGDMVSESDRHRKALDPRATHGARAESLSSGRGAWGAPCWRRGAWEMAAQPKWKEAQEGPGLPLADVWSLVGSKGRAVPMEPVFSQALQLRPNNGRSARVMAVLGSPARMSAVEFLHCFLEVGIKPGHAAGKEGVHHALRKVTAEVGLEERDQAGLVGLPVKARPGLLCVWSREPAQGNGPDPGVSLGSLPRATLWTCFFSAWKWVLSWMLPWPRQAVERGRPPTSSPGRSFVPCARFTRQRLSENSLLYWVLGGTDTMLHSVH